MGVLDEMTEMGHERVVVGHERALGYRGVVAVHSTVLGPAVGGIRFMRYADSDDAIRDALKLSRAMTLKSAMAGLAWGGGKSVILGDPAAPGASELLRAHGRLIESLQGDYVGAEDVGVSPEALEHVRRETSHVAGVMDGTGDPAPATARGVYQAMRAAASRVWGDSELEGRRVAVQGCGSVGSRLALLLAEVGARLVLTDVDGGRLQAVADLVSAEVVGPAGIYDTACDIFAPCALGGVLNDETISRLDVSAVVGAANNQLAARRHDDVLRDRGIVYVPDFVANAGGVIDGHRLVAGWSEAESLDRVDAIYETTLEVLRRAQGDGCGTQAAAEALALERLRHAVDSRSPACD